MRPSFALVVVLTLFVLLGCTEGQYPLSLRMADTLTNSNPDSAVVLLGQIEAEMSVASEPVRRYYQLLRIKADDKTDRMEVNADSIKELVRYFEDGGDKSLLPTAYYYAGRVYSDLNEAPISLDYFQKSLDVMENEGIDDQKLKSVIYSQMGYLYLFQYIYDEAERCFRASYEIGVEINDTASILWGLRDLGTTYQWQERYQEGMDCLERAKLISDKTNDVKMQLGISRAIAYLLDSKKEHGLARQYMQEPMQNIQMLDSGVVLTTMASIYYNNHEIDSFIKCAKQLEHVGDAFSKEYVYNKLTDIYLKEKKIEKAGEYYNKYVLFKDSTSGITKSSELQKVHSLYKLHKEEAKNAELKRDKQIEAFIIVGILLSFICLGMFSVFFYRNRQIKAHDRISKIRMVQREIKRRSEATIEENKQKIADLENQIAALHDGHQQTLLQLESYKNRLLAQNVIAEVEKDEYDRAKKTIRNSDIYKLIVKKADAQLCLKDVDWIQIETVVNENYPDFKTRLYLFRQLTSYEFHICLLLKMGIDLYQIAILTAHSKSSVTQTRKRLYKKFFGESGTGEQWDDFIHSL